MRIASTLAIAMTCVLAMGCQNNIHMRVEKVLGVSSVSREGRIGRQLFESIHKLNNLIKLCRETQAEIDKSPTAGTLAGYRLALDEMAKQATKLRNECQAYFDPASGGLKTANPRWTLNAAVEFFNKVTGECRKWLADNRAKIKDQAPDLIKISEELVFELGRAREAAKPRFGGFVSTDVYPINPSDPMYARILKSGSPIGAVVFAPFWRNTSLETITEAKVGVSGDSAIMLVVESPGQVRVYQVSMDPTQITRNIGLLISKATAAGMKFLSGGI